MRDESRPRGWPPGFFEGETNRRAAIVLSSLRGITPRRLHDLGWKAGSAAAARSVIASEGYGSVADAAFARELDPMQVLASVAGCGARFLNPTDPEFPPRLEDLEDPPLGVYVRGRALDELEPRVAVVGARTCSPLGAEVAEDIGHELASAGVCVVSGAARGIDSASHRGALAAGGPTIAVLGSGIDVMYPAGSAGLIGAIEGVGAVVSEYPPGVPAEPHRFPARNRVVAALCQAVVVVEGGARSGSKITADHALDLGRDVFAVPGQVASPLASAPLELIREGATMIRGADDLLHDLGFDMEARGAAALADVAEGERRVLDVLSGPSLPETLAEAARLSVAETVATLMSLEIRGLVRNVGGRYEHRLKRRDPRGASA